MIRDVFLSEEHADVRFRQARPTQVVVNVSSKGIKTWLIGTVKAREAARQVDLGVVGRLVALPVAIGLQHSVP